jgi:hypothetical protein
MSFFFIGILSIFAGIMIIKENFKINQELKTLLTNMGLIHEYENPKNYYMPSKAHVSQRHVKLVIEDMCKKIIQKQKQNTDNNDYIIINNNTNSA